MSVCSLLGGGVPCLRFSGGGGYLVSVKGKNFDTRFGLIHVQTGKKNFCRGTPPPPRIARNCYGHAAGGMPLAFTQEDFLVTSGFQVTCHTRCGFMLREIPSFNVMCQNNSVPCEAANEKQYIPKIVGQKTKSELIKRTNTPALNSQTYSKPQN